MRKFVTKKEALQTVKRIKEKGLTYYYGEKIDTNGGMDYINYDSMEDMLKSLGFGGPESEFIVASMVVAGAKFTR